MSLAGDKLFYVSASDNYFGYASVERGENLMLEKMGKGEKVINFSSEQKSIIIRKKRNTALIFELDSLNIREINVQIPFTHQKILALREENGQLYILTNKDFRVYGSEEVYMTETSKSIITSCKQK